MVARCTKITIIASGGGHTAYAEAVAEQLVERAKITVIVPKGDRWTRAKMEKYGQVFETEKAAPGTPLWKRILSVLKGFLEGLRIPKADVVVATGSNHSIGPALALKLKGAKLVVIEAIDRTVTKSKAVDILSRFADIVALHWDEQKKNYPKGKVYGPILPSARVNGRNDGYVLITFGTEGFEEFFDLVAKMPDVAKRAVLQTGKVPADKYADRFLKVFQFDPEFNKWLAEADVVVTHQGATAAEAAIIYKKPTIIVFNHKLTGTSGRKDTEVFARKVGAVFVERYSEFNGQHILQAKTMAKEIKHENGSTKLAEDVLRLAK